MHGRVCRERISRMGCCLPADIASANPTIRQAWSATAATARSHLDGLNSAGMVLGINRAAAVESERDAEASRESSRLAMPHVAGDYMGEHGWRACAVACWMRVKPGSHNRQVRTTRPRPARRRRDAVRSRRRTATFGLHKKPRLPTEQSGTRCPFASDDAEVSPRFGKLRSEAGRTESQRVQQVGVHACRGD